jgi:hypothetical protein
LKPNLVAITTRSRTGFSAYADHLLIGEGAIDLGGVEESNAALYRRAYQRDTLLLTDRSCIAEVEPHAAEADG